MGETRNMTDRPNLGALGPRPVAERLLGILRHQPLELGRRVGLAVGKVRTVRPSGQGDGPLLPRGGRSKKKAESAYRIDEPKRNMSAQTANIGSGSCASSDVGRSDGMRWAGSRGARDRHRETWRTSVGARAVTQSNLTRRRSRHPAQIP
jgi:hypothetical protein